MTPQPGKVHPRHDFYLDERGEIDRWVVDSGFHNGPGCQRCGEMWCDHCEPERANEECVEDLVIGTGTGWPS